MKKSLSLLLATVAISSSLTFAGGGWYVPSQDISMTASIVQIINNIKDPALQTIVQKHIIRAASNSIIADDTYNTNHFFTKGLTFVGEIPEELAKHVTRAYVLIGQFNYASGAYIGPNWMEVGQVPVDISKISKGITVDISKIKSTGTVDYGYTVQLILELGEGNYIPYSLIGNVYGLNTQGIDARVSYLSTLLYTNGYVNINDFTQMGETTLGGTIRDRLTKMRGDKTATSFNPILEALATKVDTLVTETADKQKKLVESIESDDGFKAVIPEAKKLQFRLEVLSTLKSIIQETLNIDNSNAIVNEILPRG